MPFKLSWPGKSKSPRTDLWNRLKRFRDYAPIASLEPVKDREIDVAKPSQLIDLSALLCEAGDYTTALYCIRRARRRIPDITDRFRYLGATAALARLDPALAAEYPLDVAAMAHLDRFNDRFAELIERHRDSICVVGNGPTEIGHGRGREIDEHDLVIRFNGFSTGPQHRPDYGEKTDIWVRHHHYRQIARRPGFTPQLTICSSTLPWRVRNGQNLAIEYATQDLALTYCPTLVAVRLAEQCGARASAGLRALEWIRQILGGLSSVHVYGFSREAEQDSNAHYYLKASSNNASHDWSAEKRLLNEMLAQSANAPERAEGAAKTPAA